MNKKISSKVVFISLTTLAMVSTQGCSGTSKTQLTEPCPPPPRHSNQYEIGPGDTLQIVVWRNDELSTVVPVRPDGRISTPLVDDLQASGLTPSALARSMEEVLSEYLRTPEVSIIVTDQGSSNQIQVIGEVLRPQSVSFRDNLKLLDVIVAVGGLTEFAAGNRTNLIRQTGSGQVECRVRLKNLLAGDMSENIDVGPGDVIIVPEARF